MVAGKVIPLTEYPEPFQAAEETTTSALVADRVPVRDELLPTATLPKLNVDGETASVPEPSLLEFCDCGPEDTPEQPVRTDTAVRAATPTKARTYCLSILRTKLIIDLQTRAVERAKSQDRVQNSDLYLSNREITSWPSGIPLRHGLLRNEGFDLIGIAALLTACVHRGSYIVIGSIF